MKLYNGEMISTLNKFFEFKIVFLYEEEPETRGEVIGKRGRS